MAQKAHGEEGYLQVSDMIITLLGLALTQNGGPIWNVGELRELMRYVPQSVPIVLDQSKDGKIYIVKPIEKGDWKITCGRKSDDALGIHGRLPSLPSELRVEGVLRALKSAGDGQWDLPIEISFGVDGKWLTYSLSRFDEVGEDRRYVVGGDRLCRFHTETKKFEVIRGR